MYKDLKWATVHINRHHLTNFAFGFDYYRIYEVPTNIHQASVCQLNLLFFNLTITRWQKWI